jgi:serine/threonine protein kinase
MTEWIDLAYRSVTGKLVRARAIVGEDCPAPTSLRARQIILEDGTKLRQLLPGDGDRAAVFERLDNEILAGLRLYRLVHRRDADTVVPYPPEVSRLHGYEPDSAEPFVLLYPYRGEVVSEIGRRLLPTDQNRFQVSLLRGLCWLDAAGIGHRGMTPAAIRWDRDSQRAQITDFSQATVFGVPRTIAGTSLWAGPEQRPSGVTGEVSGRDDVWGAGQMICYVLTGEELTGPHQLADVPDTAGLLNGVFTRVDDRPTARDMLARLGAPDPVPRHLAGDPLEQGRQRFYAIRSVNRAGESQADPAEQDHPAATSATAAAGTARPRPMTVALGGVFIILAVLGLVVALR